MLELRNCEGMDDMLGTAANPIAVMRVVPVLCQTQYPSQTALAGILCWDDFLLHGALISCLAGRALRMHRCLCCDRMT